MQVQDLTYAYRRRGPKALDNITLTTDGSRIAVLGPNGAGKSTLLNMLSTVYRPQTGYFCLGPYDSRYRSGLKGYRRSLGVVPQTFDAFGGMTCRELLGYVAWLRGTPASTARANIDRVLADVHLTDDADKQLRRFSGGMRQRASLAQALVGSPQLVLLDEPTVSLDPAQRDSYLELLAAVDPSVTIIMTSHVVDDIAAFADEVVVISRGQCHFAGPIWVFCGKDEPGAVSGAEVKAAYLEAEASRL